MGATGGCLFLAYCFDTDAFETDRELFIMESAPLLRQFPALFLNALTATVPKKKLRPLLDVVQRI